MTTSIEPLIRQYVNLSSNSSVKGWWSCVCMLCNDHSKRGGFNFEGLTTSYHCFNCGHATTHDPMVYSGFSENMIKVLTNFGIPKDQYKEIILNNVINQHHNNFKITKKEIEDPDVKIIEIQLPPHFIELDKSNGVWSDVATEYLINHRSVDPKSHPFYILNPIKQQYEIEREWRGRLIIPYYRNNKVVWYQGRDLRPISKLRYLNAQTTSECILSNYESLFTITDDPLFICEGFFDSHCINGIAIFGNTFKKGQMKLLNKSNRRKIYIPDNTKDGRKAALMALEQDWEISMPDIGGCKDINNAVHKYGLMYVLASLHKNIKKGYAGEIAIMTLGV